jgi:subtilisin family serine protease
MKPLAFCIPVVFTFCFLALSERTTSAEVAQTRVCFRTPQSVRYRVEAAPLPQSVAAAASGQAHAAGPEWLRAWPENGSTNFVLLSSRVVLQLNSAADLKRLTDGHSLELSRAVTSNVFILQAPDAASAVQEANRLAALSEVLASYPVMKRQIQPDGPYAPQPGDSFFTFEWSLENRNSQGTRVGADMNVRAAWPFTMGEGVTVAVADSGVELNHPELIASVTGAPHYNFTRQITNGAPFDRTAGAAHGTEVAGLIAAELGHGRIAGVAPGTKLASWVIFDTNNVVASDEQLMDMYQYAPDLVGVQNHSWGGGNFVIGQVGPTLLEQIGIANAVTLGRNGLGSVMVRSAGNDRYVAPQGILARADDDGYPDDPQVIAVAAVRRSDNRVTSYSEPGACILVAAPSGDVGTDPLLTTDLLGLDGVNQIGYFPPNQDLSGYAFNAFGFTGTSAAAPQVAGVAALVLSRNPGLGYRDVQQIIALSARQFDLADPDLCTNGAGLVVSHNVGFGIPDAGQAVWLAGLWSNRPPLTIFSITNSTVVPVPDEGLRVEVTGSGVPSDLVSIQCFPTLGPHADQPTAALSLVDIGLATNLPTTNLAGKGALILRGAVDLNTKISYAAQAGAAFAVIYNSPTNSSITLDLVAGTGFSTIPAVVISNSKGEALKSVFQTNNSALARIHLLSANRVFHVNASLLCEHVGVRVQSDHPIRGDQRITLLSPQGTRSVLQQLNNDPNPGPVDWTYWSTHHFLEGSAGDWTVSISDESAGATGSVHSVTLIIRGTQITDTDHDGLDDGWEMARLGTLAYGPKDDPDGDGFSNAREQVMGTNPQAQDVPFQLDLSLWQQSPAPIERLSWPSASSKNYEVWGGTNVTALNLLTNLPGGFPETEWFTPISGIPRQFFRVRSMPGP